MLNYKFQQIISLIPEENSDFSLPDGASDSQIEKLEVICGFDLPEQLKSLYRLHDGEFAFDSRKFVGMFFGYEFLSVQHVISAYTSLRRASNYWRVDRDEDDARYLSVPADFIGNTFFDPKWIPIGGFYGGNHIGVDLNPGPKGVMGQIINFGPDDFYHFQIALDIPSLLEAILDKYIQKQWHEKFEGINWSLYDTLKKQNRLV